MADFQNTTEVWMPIVGWEGLYAVSDLGRIKNVAHRPHTYVGRILKPVGPSDGYAHVNLYKEGRVVQKSVHCIVCEAFHGTADGYLQVNHRDGNKRNNKSENVEWATPKGNIAHGIASGLIRAQKGEHNIKAKLTEANVREIRAKPSYRGVINELADQFGVSTATIKEIRMRRLWKHIE